MILVSLFPLRIFCDSVKSDPECCHLLNACRDRLPRDGSACLSPSVLWQSPKICCKLQAGNKMSLFTRDVQVFHNKRHESEENEQK